MLRDEGEGYRMGYAFNTCVCFFFVLLLPTIGAMRRSLIERMF